ncbi:MAG: T9SS type A sorting domain-containing protein [Chitinophagaceae bacterium]|nr:T9SS type A sorting domain-containing protein [Chitinophagaceae bacterium]
MRPLASTAFLMLFISSASAQIPKFNSDLTASATVYLDFDGHVVKGTSWNWDSTIHAQPSGLKTAAITEIFNRVAEDYRIFNINITTDSSVFAKAPAGKRVRIIVTPTSKWYGIAGGISFVNSFTWGDGTPAFVFTDILQNNSKYIGEACSHETGHTLGLQHQSTFDKSCGLVTEYAEGKGDGEIGWAPIMGVSYYKNQTTWNVGTSIEGCSIIQNDIDIISKGLNNIGFRSDDHGNTLQNATPVTFTNITFSSHGMINNATDVDVFKVVLNRPGLFKTTITPSNVGTGNAGANLDIKMTLVKSNGDTIGRYNPRTLLSASVDTNLAAGTYFMVVDGVANQNTKDYNSIGYYNITGGFDAVLPITKLTLKGNTDKNVHFISWDFETDEPVNTTMIESSKDGTDFKTIASVSPAVTRYRNNPLGKGSMFYRIKMLAGQDNTPYYSNIISLDYATAGKVELMGNVIQGSAVINVSGNYNYDLLDETGRLLQRGKLIDGFNNISINSMKKGMMLLRVYSESGQVLFKVIKQ